MFLGQHYLFLHWGSCSQIPQNKHIWEYWACILRTRDWRCTSASKRKSQAVFLGKQEKRACNRFYFWLWLCPFLHHHWNTSSVPSRQPLFITSEPGHYFDVLTLILLESIMLPEVSWGGSHVHWNLRAVQLCFPVLPHQRRQCFSPVVMQTIPSHWGSPAEANSSTSMTTDLYNHTNHSGKFCHQKKDRSLDFCVSYAWKMAEVQKNESKHHA